MARTQRAYEQWTLEHLTGMDLNLPPIPCLIVNAIMKFITTSRNDLHKLLGAWLIEIYDWGIISVMYLIQEG